jgi:signal peptidase I
VKNEQREGLEELARWRASLAGAATTGNGDGDVAADELPSEPPRAEARSNVLDTAEVSEIDDDPADEASDEVTEVDLEDDDDDEKATRSPGRVLFDWLVVVGVALLVALVIRTFVLAHFVVDGTSMVSTLHDGDRVFVNKLSYRLGDPGRGDVVVLHEFDGRGSRDLIKRVIGLPGEEIEMRSCQVLIDGRLLEEPYLDPEVVQPGNCGGDFAEVTVEDDHVFVMGDNRGGSQDSRDLGTIHEDDLEGRAFVVFWPRSNWQWL